MPRIVIGVTKNAFEAVTEDERNQISRALRYVACAQLATRLGDENLDSQDISVRWIVYDDHDNEFGLEIDLIFSATSGADLTEEQKEGVVNGILMEIGRWDQLRKPEFREIGIWIRPSVGGFYKSRITNPG